MLLPSDGQAHRATPNQTILAMVNRHLNSTGMTPDAFGRHFANDSALVSDLRHGRKLDGRATTRLMAVLSREAIDA